jgi:hypothetical protein
MESLHEKRLCDLYTRLQHYRSALDFAHHIDAFYRDYSLSDGTNEIDFLASSGALEFILSLAENAEITKYTKVIFPKYAEKDRGPYLISIVDIRRSKSPLAVVACFPGPSPDFTKDRIKDEDSSEYRILIEGKNRKMQSLRASVNLMSGWERINDRVRNFCSEIHS